MVMNNLRNEKKQLEIMWIVKKNNDLYCHLFSFSLYNKLVLIFPSGFPVRGGCFLYLNVLAFILCSLHHIIESSNEMFFGLFNQAGEADKKKTEDITNHVGQNRQVEEINIQKFAEETKMET